MTLPRARWILLGLLAAVVGLAAGLWPRWKAASDLGGQRPAEPFRVAGNVYFVGANDVSAFLVTGPAGHVLLDGGYPAQAPMIAASIERLGFRVRDVRVLLNSEPHFDHAGGLAALQRASGAALWASAASAPELAAGGVTPDAAWWVRAVQRAVGRYPAPRVDRVVRDGDTVRVGPVALIAHLTPGHSRGCTSWEIPVREGGRALRVVSACSLVRLGVARYPGQAADFAGTFRTLRARRPDVWVTSHGRLWGRYRKFAACGAGPDSTAPFVDPAGYLVYVDSGEAEWRRGVVR